MKNQGIVLKDYSPIKNKLVIFDEILGKIEAIYKNQKYMSKIPVGSIVNYNMAASNRFFKLDNINIIFIPLDFAREHVLFMHHLLELCYYFLQEQDPSEEIFQLVVFVYKNFHKLERPMDKKNILCKFFAILGIYPETVNHFPKEFLNLISSSISSNFTSDKLLKKYVNRWLLECVYTHSSNSKFRTLKFLKS